MTDWTTRCAYNPEAKQRFHTAARARLRELADYLGFAPEDYDLRSNVAGVAVSGEITLHHDTVYIQVSQSCMGPENGVLIRTCEGRRDYTGGRNHFAPLRLLDDTPALAAQMRAVMATNRQANIGSMPANRPAPCLTRLTVSLLTAKHRREGTAHPPRIGARQIRSRKYRRRTQSQVPVSSFLRDTTP
jgi:hypothetical protein